MAFIQSLLPRLFGSARVPDYAQGLKQFNQRDYAGALKQWQPLAS